MPRHRQFTPEFKAQVILEVVSGQKTAADICREHNLKPDLVSKWKTYFLAEAVRVFQREEPADPQQARIAELERLAGKLSLELEVAKKASLLLNSPASRNGS
jgi:transposase-like protein